jgi:hypothetical protein
VAIGIYLPLELEVPILAGGIIHQVIRVYHRKRQTVKEKVELANRRGLLFASGLITGEALVGIGLAIPIVLSGRPDVLAVLEKPFGVCPGVVLLVGVAYWLYRTALGRGREENASQGQKPEE